MFFLYLTMIFKFVNNGVLHYKVVGRCWSFSLTVWVLPKWGHLKTVSSNIAKRLIEEPLLNYFHQPPFWQYLVSGSGFLIPYAQHSLCPKVGVQTSHNLLKVFIVILNVVCHTNKINSRAE